jgi:hypothetical protein
MWQNDKQWYTLQNTSQNTKDRTCIIIFLFGDRQLLTKQLAVHKYKHSLHKKVI